MFIISKLYTKSHNIIHYIKHRLITTNIITP